MSNREQDARIAKLMGLPVKYHTDNPNNERWYYLDSDDDSELICEDLPDYSSDISLAMQAIEWMRDEREFFITIVPQMNGYLLTASDYQAIGNYYCHLCNSRADSFKELPDAICNLILLIIEPE